MPHAERPTGSKVTMLIRIVTTDVLTEAERATLVDASAKMFEDLLQCARMSGKVEIAEIGGDIMIMGSEGGVRV
jgi:hypothetical protein